MTTVETSVTGIQKVAIVLMQMNQAKAALVMQQFSEAEAHEIASEIVRLRRVDAGVAESVLTEFHDLTLSGKRHAHGGKGFAAGLLEASFGAEVAAGVMNRLASTMAGKSFEFLDAAEPGQIVAMIDGELPQTIALVLAHLRPSAASAVMAGLNGATRTDVAQCIATMGSATPEAVAAVADALKARAGAVVAPDYVDSVGGIQPLVEIINRSDISTEKAVLDGLQERDPELAEEVRSRMLTFSDIVKLERRDVQRILRGVNVSVLALAMKGASGPVLEMIHANVSERNLEILESEIGSLGPVRASQVEEARAEIVRSIRELEAEGSITVRRGDEDAFVY
jgi:flagellar motor switch protein FliG